MPDLTPNLAPVPVEPTPLLLIQQGIDAKISPRDMKDLFDLQVRYEQRLAEQAYADAITGFQSENQPIKKNAVNSHSGKRYADYEGIMRAITPLLRKYRIVVTFDTADDGQRMMTTCRVRVGTVEKLTTITLPLDAASKMMNATQAGGAAMSYGRRYALTAALNIVVTDEDTDAQPDTGTISGPQQNELDGLLRDAGCQNSNHLRLALDWIAKAQGYPCDSLADVTCAAFPRIKAEFQARAARRAQAEAAKKANGGAACA